MLLVQVIGGGDVYHINFKILGQRLAPVRGPVGDSKLLGNTLCDLGIGIHHQPKRRVWVVGIDRAVVARHATTANQSGSSQILQHGGIIPPFACGEGILTRMFEDDGYKLIPEVLALPMVERLRAALGSAGDGSAAGRSQRGESVYAQRNILTLAEVQAVAADPRVLALTGGATIATRALFFDKVPGANWHVGWHQDRAIAVAKRQELPGWGPWTVKAGVVHVLPPAAILEKMITVRLHLDDCDENNGPLRVLPGSHRHGILSAEQLAALRRERPEALCTGLAGSAVVLSPLLLHASSPAQSPLHRRVLHIEFAPENLLPEGLAWAI